MIRGSAMTAIVVMSKPRASGDDPDAITTTGVSSS